MSPSQNPFRVVRPGEQRARWARFLDAVLPAPNENRLVSVAEVGRSGLPLIEGSLADIGLSPVVQEVRTFIGESRFQILVPACHAEMAAEAVTGF